MRAAYSGRRRAWPCIRHCSLREQRRISLGVGYVNKAGWKEDRLETLVSLARPLIKLANLIFVSVLAVFIWVIRACWPCRGRRTGMIRFRISPDDTATETGAGFFVNKSIEVKSQFQSLRPICWLSLSKRRYIYQSRGNLHYWRGRGEKNWGDPILFTHVAGSLAAGGYASRSWSVWLFVFQSNSGPFFISINGNVFDIVNHHHPKRFKYRKIEGSYKDGIDTRIAADSLEQRKKAIFSKRWCQEEERQCWLR